MLVRRLRRILQSIPSEELRRSDVAFLHVGKCAGTQISRLADKVNESKAGVFLQKMPHEVKLRHLPAGQPYFFSIRDPVSRFRSGFYSRKRMGMPRIYSGWSSCEMEAFKAFDSANDLAEALFDCGKRGAEARGAIASIRHTSMHQVDWFEQMGNFFSIWPPIYIIRQERFDSDFNELLNRLGLNFDLDELKKTLTKADAHKNTYEGEVELSALAIRNLERWYARDHQFYRDCESWMHATVFEENHINDYKTRKL